MNTFKITFGVSLLLVFFSVSLLAEVRLSGVFSDHMVIQRNQPIKVWGWAEKGEKVEVAFKDVTLSVKANKAGNWQVIFPSSTQGGPYQLVVKGKNTLVLSDILIGDVWFCSGQSNMDMEVKFAGNPEIELKDTNYPDIRLFSVPQSMSDSPQKDMIGKWKSCNPETVKNFSAVAFFFGRNLNEDLKVPIGLLQSSWGGTAIQRWMSSEAISQFPVYLAALADLKTKDYKQLLKERDQHQTEWMDTLRNFEPGTVGKWYLPEENDANWKSVNVPASWQSVGLKGNGVGWFRKEIELSEEQASHNVLFFMGMINNAEETYLNGQKIGECADYSQLRIYPATPQQLRKGKNVLAVKVYNYWGDGGFWGNASELHYQTNTGNYSLAGEWKCKKGNFGPNPALVINPNNHPTLLYNAMVSPCINFPIKGVIWFQGEQNTDNPAEYHSLLPAMIKDWRIKWNIGNFPFLIVQLSNFMKVDKFPVQSNWAELREAQYSALTLPNTGLAVTIDIGEAENIHAKNKQDVGYRLALAARKIAYNENIVFSGPVFKCFKTEGNKVSIEFNNIGSGLITFDKYGYIKGFALAGIDRTFYWAKAFIKDNKIILYCDKVIAPVSIRYAWGNNPDASLYNVEGLPAVPFRTDSW